MTQFLMIAMFNFFLRWFLKFQHVDPTEAVCIHEDIGSRFSLGIHWGTFPTGYEVKMNPAMSFKCQTPGPSCSNYLPDKSLSTG